MIWDLALTPFELPPGTALRSDVGNSWAVKPSTNGAFVLPLLDELQIQGRVPNLQEDRELSV